MLSQAGGPNKSYRKGHLDAAPLCILQFRADALKAARTDVVEALVVFARQLNAVIAFDHGPNVDLERKSPDHGASFIIRFKHQAALQLYAVDPTHQALGEQLCDFCEGSADGVIVYDLIV